MDFLKLAFIVAGICVGLVPEKLLAAHLNTGNNDVFTWREKRSDPEPNNCGNWSAWINNNTPTSTNKTDGEVMSPSEMDRFCPHTIGGNITQMLCLDNMNGLFVGVHEDDDRQYNIRCNNIHEGVVCSLENVDAVCPDVAVKYFCSCSKPPPSSVEDNDSSSSEEDGALFDDLSQTLLFYHTVPTASALLLVIILCCITIIILCKKKMTAAVNPLSKLPMGTGHLF